MTRIRKGTESWFAIDRYWHWHHSVQKAADERIGCGRRRQTRAAIVSDVSAAGLLSVKTIVKSVVVSAASFGGGEFERAEDEDDMNHLAQRRVQC